MSFTKTQPFKLYPIGLTLTATIIAYIPTWTALESLWRDGDSIVSHGWLIVAIFIFLVLHGHSSNSNLIQSRPSYALPLTALTSLAIALCHLTGILTIQAALLPVLIAMTLTSIYGIKYTASMLVPIFYLYFALPVWHPLVPLLQSTTTLMSGQLLNLTNIPHLINGNFITIPAGIFEVAGGCSGIKYFVTSFALSTLYAHLYIPTRLKQIGIVVIALAIAIGMNWARVYIIVFVGHETEMQHSLIRDHNNFGWVLYAITMIPFFFLANRFSDPVGQEPKVEHIKTPPLQVTLTAVVTLLLPATLLSAYSILPKQDNLLLLNNTNEWSKHETSASNWQPNYSNETRYIANTYNRPQSPKSVDVDIKIYMDQSQDNEMINFMNTIHNKNWKTLNSNTLEARPSFQVNEVVLSNKSQQKILVWYWYQLGLDHTPSPLITKILQLKQTLTMKDGAALIAFSTTCNHANCETARSSIRTFFNATNYSEY